MRFTEEHEAIRATAAKFIDTEINPHAAEWEAAGIFPAHELFRKLGMPDFCPLMMRKFAAAHASLASDPGLAARTRLLTLSFDPAHDTPDVLRAFGKPFQKTAPPFTHWALATGKDEAIRALGGALELEYVEEARSFTHNLRTVVLDREGKLRRLFRGSDWTPEELVAELRAAAGT